MRYMLAAATLIMAASTNAAPLVTGANPLSGTTAAAEPNLAGTVVQDVTKPFTFTSTTGTLSGSVQNRVVRSVDGTYDFYWRIFGITGAGRPEDIGAFRIGQFGSTVVGVNANYRTDGSGTTGPDTAFVFTSPGPNYVNFLFGDGLGAGDDSRFFFLDTAATSYAENAIYDFSDAGSTQISGLYTTFGPGGGAVPEPASWALMIGGVGLAGAALRRRPAVRVRYA